MNVSRRKLVVGSLAALAVAGTGMSFLRCYLARSSLRASTNEFYRRLPVPQLIDAREVANTVVISSMKGLVEFMEGFEAETYGYSAAYLGPAIRVHRGDTVAIKVMNELDIATTVHWHGLFVPSDQDGGPYNLIAPGESWEPKLRIDQPASTAWFHPQLYGGTGRQVYMGLAGIFYIEDESSRDLGLPSRYGVDDIPLVLQDRSFGSAGELEYDASPTAIMRGSRGDLAVINGVIGPVAEVPKGIVRLRVLNAANARIFRLTFDDGRAMQVIAADNGFLSAPVTISELTIAPGERFEILVDFSDAEIAVLLTYPDHNGETPSGMSPLSRAIADITDVLIPLVRFDPTDEIQPVITSAPRKLANLANAEADKTLKRHFFLLDPMAGANARFTEVESGLAAGMKMGINGKPFDKSRIDVTVNRGGKEIWEVHGSEMAHPFHIHGASFRILSLDGAPPPAHLSGPKDTVLITEAAELLISFDQVTDPAKPFVFHCDILEHQDAGMMAQYITM